MIIQGLAMDNGYGLGAPYSEAAGKASVTGFAMQAMGPHELNPFPVSTENMMLTKSHAKRTRRSPTKILVNIC